MAGELQNNTKYLNSLQAITDIDYIFPNSQKSYTFDDSEVSDYDVHIQWHTLVVDEITYDRAELPDFSQSTVIGYFEGSTGTAQTTAGVVTIPEFMYDGKILPASDRYVPVTVVNLRWERADGSSYSKNIAYIQQWEPGIPIGDPRDDHQYEPIDPVASQLVLSAVDRVIEGDSITFTAVSDIPIDLGADNPCTFYRMNGATPVEIGTVFFNAVSKTATLTYDTTGLAFGNTDFYAEFGGRREYGRTTSNTLTIEILEGIPLLVDFETFNPSKAVYAPGDNINYTLGVIPDPFFTPSGVAVANSLTMVTVNGFPPPSTSTFFTGNFSNGVATGTISVLASMIDTALAHTGTNWTITTSTQNTTTYTATIFVTNTETVRTAWGYQTLGQYARGSTSTSIQVGTTTTRTVIADPFPLVLTQNSTSTLQEESFTVTLGTTSSPYYNNITIIAQNQATGSTSTLFSGNNSGTSSFATTVSTLTTGTYTIYASYPGDIGNNIYRANRASVSNTLTHVVRSGNELGARFVFYTTASYDILRVWASTSTTLTQAVSFVQGTTLGTGTWTRNTVEYLDPRQTLIKSSGTFKAASFANNFTSNSQLGIGWATPNNDGNNDLTIITPAFRGMPGAIDDTYYNKSANWPSPKDVNKYRLFKYYDGSNYDLIEVTGTQVTAIADPIEFHDNDWTLELYRTEEFNLNAPFINTNTSFYNYIESRFGYANMIKYLETCYTLDGSPLKLNDLVFNDRPPVISPPAPVKPYPRLSSYTDQMVNKYWDSTADSAFAYGTLDFATVVPDSGVYLPPNWENNTNYKMAVCETYGRAGSNDYIGVYADNDVIKYTIRTKNVPDGTVFTYEQIGTITQGDLIYGSTTGTITVNDNFGFAEFICDVSTSKTFRLRLRYQPTGQIVGLENYRNPFGVTSDDPWNTIGRGFLSIIPNPAEGYETFPLTVDKTTLRRGQTLTVTVRYPEWAGPGRKLIYITEGGIGRYPIGPKYTYYAEGYPSYIGVQPDGYNYRATFTFNIPESPPGNVEWAGPAYSKFNTKLCVFGVEFATGFPSFKRAQIQKVNITLQPLITSTPLNALAQTVRRNIYDIYRTDILGDARGYNVVAINASTTTPRPVVSEEDPRRLYFMGANNKERYIDLVEYIGEVEWQKPIENAQQKAGTQARSTVRVWLYKFTPTIPQANTIFRTAYEVTSAMDLDPYNNWQPRPMPGYPGNWVTGDGSPYNNYYRDVNFIGAERAIYGFTPPVPTWPRGQDSTNGWFYYQNYGYKTWTSANTSDPAENDRAAFYNDWYRTFTTPDANIYTKNVYTTTYDVVVTDDLQSATLLLPSGTITTSTSLRSTWPGTRYLDPIYGRFNPFDIPVSSAFTGVDLDAYQVIPNSTATITATIVTSVNPVDLVATVISEPLNIAANTGTVTFYNADTLQVINTATVSNSTATIRVFADNLTNLTSAPFVRIQSRYQPNNITPATISDIVTLQAVKTTLTTSTAFLNTNTTSMEIFNWSASYPSNIPGNSITKLNGTVDLQLPAIYSATTSGYATFRIFLNTITCVFLNDPVYPGVDCYTQYLGVPSSSKQWYRDVTIPINGQLPTSYRINLINEPMWLTPEWWRGTRPGDPRYWPVSAPGIFASRSYVSSVQIGVTAQLLGGLQVVVGSKIAAQASITVGR